jgi:hypothetical protein
MKQHPDSPAVATATFAASPEFASAEHDSLQAELNPPPAPDHPLVPQPCLVPEPAPPPAADEADEDQSDDEPSFDPAAYKWVPVLRKPRKDGWTPQRQVEFIATLGDTGCVEMAAQAVGMSVMSCYRLRRAPEAAAFAQAWDIALHHAAKRLLDIAFERAVNGSDEPVFDRKGHAVGRRMRQNDRLLMFLLRAFMPDRFRHAHRDGRAPAEPLPLAPEPLDQALDRIAPPPPPEPHRLMPPEELETALECADILDGELPHWHRGRGDTEKTCPDSPFGEEFERRLEEAKAGDPPRGRGRRTADAGEDDAPFA